MPVTDVTPRRTEEWLFDGWPCDMPMLMRQLGPEGVARLILQAPNRWSYGVPEAVPCAACAASMKSLEKSSGTRR